MAAEANETKKPSWKPKLYSDFTMGELDFKRFHQLLLTLDNISLEIQQFSASAVPRYFALLKVIYINWRPLIARNDDIANYFDRMFSRADELISKNKQKNYSDALYRLLTEIHINLIQQKQYLGFGIKVSVQKDYQKIKESHLMNS